MFRNYKDYIPFFQKQLQALKKERQKIIIFGACPIGLFIERYLKKLDIEIECFFDNEKEKQGKKYDGVPVKSPYATNLENVVVYICALNFNNVKLIKKQLSTLGYQHCEVPLFLFYGQSINTEIQVTDYDGSIAEKIADPVVIDILSAEITERCSLRCSDCINLMPYYKAPKNYDKQTMINSIRKIAESVDFIEHIDVVGGEPMLHPDLLEICEKISEIPNIFFKCIITNASIPPRKDFLISLKKSKFFIKISYYGNLSRFIDQWIRMMDDLGITYEVRKPTELWSKLGKPSPHGRTDVENQELYNTCLFSGCHMLLNNAFYSCGHAGNMALLGASKKIKGEFVDLNDPNLTPEDIYTQMKTLLARRMFLSACDFCNGSAADKIEPASQAKGILDF